MNKNAMHDTYFIFMILDQFSSECFVRVIYTPYPPLLYGKRGVYMAKHIIFCYKYSVIRNSFIDYVLFLPLYCNRIELSQNLAVMTGVDGKELSSYLVYNRQLCVSSAQD